MLNTNFVGGVLSLASHILLWRDVSDTSAVCLPLSLVVFLEEQSSGFAKRYLNQMLQEKKWEQKFLPPARAGVQGARHRPGIVGIERSLQQKHKQTDSSISQSFQDLKKLMQKAQEMVTLSKSIVTKIKDKQGEITEDETVKLKAYLLSMGIPNPVTRESHGTGDKYYQELARELAKVLEKPIQTTAMSKITANNVTIRQHKPGDIKVLMDFSEENQWDLSTYDHQAYSRIDPHYLLVAVDESDEPVGFCGGSLHTSDIIYFGNFIVRKDLRGKGIGKLLWKAFLEKAAGKNMVLDGGSAMEGWYLTHGFPFKAFRVRYCHVTITGSMKKSIESKYETVTLSDEMWPALMEYDRKVYPNFDRTNILRAWFTGDDVRVVVAMDAGKIIGYGSINMKPSPSTGYSLRNIFADNEAVIEAILYDLLSGLPNGAVVLFWLLDDKPLPKYIKHSVNFEETARRMYSKYIIEVNTEKMWFATAHIV